MPEKPTGDVPKIVQDMNADAEKRAGKSPEAPTTPKKVEEEKPEGGKGEGKKEEKGTSRMDFLHEVGDKKVPNPNPDSRARFPQIKIRSLPWEHQKKFYQQWTQRQAATRVVRRYMDSVTAAEPTNKIEQDLRSVASDVHGAIKSEHYEVEMRGPKGPVFYLILKNAQGDVSEAKRLRPKIEAATKEALKKHMGYDKYSVAIGMSSRTDDMQFAVEIIFP